jgi:hypothetical protein
MPNYLWILLSLIVSLCVAGQCGNLCYHVHESFLMSLMVFQLIFWMTLTLCYQIKYSITTLPNR